MATLSQIRPALPSDLPAVVDLSLALCRETEGRDLDPDVVRAGVRAMLGDSRWIVLVAENDAGDLIGEIMVGGREWYDWADGEFWWITSVYVQPEARQNGVGRALYARVRALAQAARPRVIGLRGCVRQDNTLAHTVLNHLGREFHGQVVFEERFCRSAAES